MKTVLLSIFILSSFFNPTPEKPCGEWTYQTQQGKTKVFVRQCGDSPLKEIKVVDYFYADIDKIARVVNDVETALRISNNCTEARLVKHINNNETIQYFYFDMPMGISDRDIVLKNTFYQTPTSFKSVSEIYTDPSVAARKGVIRMTNAHSSYYFEKQNDGTVKMEYIAYADPQGSVPSWFINYLVSKESLKIVEKLKRQFES